MTAGIILIVFFILYQQLENHVLQPLVYSRTVRLSPLVILVSVLIGAQIAGVLGALAAIPVAGAILLVLLATYLASRIAGKHSVIDTAWGLLYCAAAAVAFITSAGHGNAGRRWLLLVVTLVWGLRLAVHIGRRSVGKGEDPRYEEMLRDRGSLQTIGLVYGLQGLLAFLVAMPILVGSFETAGLGPLAWFGVLLWAVGLVFEGFGPVGELRAKDLGGKPVATTATFPDAKDRTGLPGLREYLRDRRQDDFLDNLCRKLLSYALGRSLLLSDHKTLAAMRARLAADEYAFGSLVETIVTSPQFLNKRGKDDARE